MLLLSHEKGHQRGRITLAVERLFSLDIADIPSTRLELDHSTTCFVCHRSPQGLGLSATTALGGFRDEGLTHSLIEKN